MTRNLDSVAESFGKLRIDIREDASLCEQASDLLSNINQDFHDLWEDWLIQSNDEKSEKVEKFTQTQKDFHTIAVKLLHEQDVANGVTDSTLNVLGQWFGTNRMEVEQVQDLRFGEFNQSQIPNAQALKQVQTTASAQSVIVNDSKEKSDDDGKLKNNLLSAGTFEQQAELLSAFFELPKMETLNPELIQKVIQTIEKVSACAKRRGIIIDKSIMYSLVMHLTTLLDNDTRTCWKYRVMSHEPTFEFFIEFLNIRKQDPQATQASPSQSKFVIPKKSVQERLQPKVQHPRSRSSSAGSSNAPPPNKRRNSGKAKVCSLCHGMHKLCDCPKFEATRISDREGVVTRLKLCKSCFSNNHETKNCPKNPCTACKAKHHPMMHHR